MLTCPFVELHLVKKTVIKQGFVWERLWTDSPLLVFFHVTLN